MNKQKIIAYLKSKKETLKEQHKIISIGFYSSYTENKSTDNSNIFYAKNNSFELKRLIFNE